MNMNNKPWQVNVALIALAALCVGTLNGWWVLLFLLPLCLLADTPQPRAPSLRPVDCKPGDVLEYEVHWNTGHPNTVTRVRSDQPPVFKGPWVHFHGTLDGPRRPVSFYAAEKVALVGSFTPKPVQEYTGETH